MHRTATTALALALFAGNAAAALSISTAERRVEAMGNLSAEMPMNDLKLSNSVGAFDQAAGVAMTGQQQLISALAAQDTIINGLSASGEGLASATVNAMGQDANAMAMTAISLTISADETFDLLLSYDLGALVTSGSTANSTLTLVNLDTQDVVFSVTSGGGNDQLIMGMMDFQLIAGSYGFSIVADTSYDAGNAMSLASAASADFSFDLQIIPTPASAALMGLGLAAATRRRR